MSVLTRLHDVLARILGVGRQDVADLLEAITEHVAPLVEAARGALLTDLRALIAQSEADARQLGTEAVADLKAELAEVKADLAALKAAAGQQTADDVTVTGPAAPSGGATPTP